jgi:hypothetical protein
LKFDISIEVKEFGTRLDAMCRHCRVLEDAPDEVYDLAMFSRCDQENLRNTSEMPQVG